MPKSAILNIERPGMIETIPLKQMLLLFDRLYVDFTSLHMAELDIKRSKKLRTEEKEIFVKDLQFLKDGKLLNTFTIDQSTFEAKQPDIELLQDMQSLQEEIGENVLLETIQSIDSTSRPGVTFQMGIAQLTNEMIFKAEDLRLRMAAVQLAHTQPTTHFVPLVNSFDSYGKKSSADSVLHFTLGKIPVPSEVTSWEQILDFRTDKAVQRKYYALINWINTVSEKEQPIAHVADQYNQLYHEYLHEYSLHKLTSNYTTIELLLLHGLDAAAALLQQNFLSALKGLVHIRKEQVNRLKAEKNIPGRELAYIVAAQKAFS